MNMQLFEGKRIRLAPPDPEKDAETESQWTHDPEYLRLLDAEPAKPLSVGQIKKKHEALAKEQGQKLFQFAIRTQTDDRLIGFVKLFRIEWSHGAGNLTLGIGSPDDRGKGYGTEALKLSLNYAFNELNLYRLSAATFEYNTDALRFLERAGFQVEVRRRQAINRDGRRWDLLVYGLLREEWEASKSQN